MSLLRMLSILAQERLSLKLEQLVSEELADTIQDAAVPYVMIQTEERNVKVLSNMMVNIANYVDFDPAELGIVERVYYPVLEGLLEEYGDDDREAQGCHRERHVTTSYQSILQRKTYLLP